MAHERLVAVSYPVDGEFTSINADVLGDLATLSYTEAMPEDERADVLRQAEVLIGLRLQHEVPAGVLQSAPGLRFIGPSSAMSFGPLFRFVVGADYTARVVSSSLASRGRSAP